MIELPPWSPRTFTFDLPPSAFPLVLERLRGTPARAAELVVGANEESLSYRPHHTWSAKENLGHVADLHPLDETRLHEFLARAAVLSAADPANRITANARHNDRPINDVLDRLRTGRMALVRKLEALSENQVSFTSIHPRLELPMRLLDWAVYVAEHDDHHLARARRALLEADRSSID